MQLNQIRAVVRPRTPWEAIDLGFVLVSQSGWALYRLWLAFLLPTAVLVYALLLAHPGWAAWSLWLLKPLLDIVLLYFFSHALFGHAPGVRQTLRALPSLLWRQHLWFGWLWLRLQIGRGFELPVWQLENQGRKSRKQRLLVLQKGHTEVAQWLNVACWCGEWALYLSSVGLLVFFVPESYVDDWDLGRVLLHDADSDPGVVLLLALFNVCSIALVEPFFVAGGFALYLNRRTHLEGWDIELVFRHMAGRLGKAEATQGG